MGIKRVEVARGLILKVNAGIDADGNVTGRINGKTYADSTWDGVERKIKLDYADTRQWTKYIVLQVHDPDANFHRGFNTHNGYTVDRDARASVHYMVLEATQPVHNDGVKGIFSRQHENGRLRFHKGATDPEEALGANESCAVLVWSEALEAKVMALCDEVEELARRFVRFVQSRSLATSLMEGQMPFELNAAPEDSAKPRPTARRPKKTAKTPRKGARC